MAKHAPSSRLAAVMRALLAAVAMALLMAWLGGAFRERVTPGPSEAPTLRLPAGVPTLEVKPRRVTVHRDATGAVTADHEVAVASLLLGRVREVAVEAGQAVAAGDVVVRIEDAEQTARVAQARAALAQAEDTRQRTQRLFERAAASDEQRAQADLAVEAATARLAEAETHLGYTIIRAPAAGVIVDRYCEVGDTVSPGQVLARLYDRLRFVARVPESLKDRVEKGQTLTVTIDALGASCEGTVAEIVPYAETAARAFQVKVEGPCHPGVIPGMYGRLRIPLGEREEVRIPEGALVRVGQLTSVLVATPDGVLHRRFVRLGASEAGEVTVVSGLGAGDVIVADARHPALAEARAAR